LAESLKSFFPGKFDSFTFESSSRETFRVILKNDFGFKILFVKFLFFGISQGDFFVTFGVVMQWTGIAGFYLINDVGSF
jgi:hypothetical protein